MTRNVTTLELYLAHRATLIAYAATIVGDRGRAEDVVQEAYLRLDAVAAARPLDEPIGYLYRIVRNLALDVRRRLRREARYLEPATDAIVDRAEEARPSPEAQALARDELRALRTAMAELPERTRIALEMHRFGGCTLKVIAAELGISVTTAHELVMRGIDHCRRRVDAAS